MELDQLGIVLKGGESQLDNWTPVSKVSGSKYGSPSQTLQERLQQKASYEAAATKFFIRFSEQKDDPEMNFAEVWQMNSTASKTLS